MGEASNGIREEVELQSHPDSKVIQHEDDRVQFNYHLYKSVQLSIDRVDQPRHHPI